MTTPRRLALGLDFGTESVRALLVEVASGEPVGRGSSAYAPGVIEETLPDRAADTPRSNGARATPVRLPPDFALQAPRDYLDSLTVATRAALAAANARGDEVVGIGLDFTACTMLPIDATLAPLCEDPRFRDEPHAWVKLWKHHGANAQAAAINRLARDAGEPWLARYGGTISSEWLLPKAWETLVHAPAVYAAAAHFVEASDWVVAELTGRLARGACAAGYKGLWHALSGPPSRAFLARLDPRLADFFETKAAAPVVAAGTAVGGLTGAWASRLALPIGTPVSAAIIDAHAAVAGAGVTTSGVLVAILGTSACHMLIDRREVLVPGIQGVVADGILPGFYGYEAGQAAFGDTFDWYVERLLGTPSADQPRVHADLAHRAAALPAGKSGLLVLDWWNGNRSVLVEPRLTGLIVGLTHATRPEQLYRGLIEGAAFSTRKIIESFVSHGLPVDEVVVCGGIAEKNELVLQLLADITGRRIARVATGEVCALGAAIFGAVAAGGPRGCATVDEAVATMAARDRRIVQPRPGETKMYDLLYSRWLRLHDHFGRLREPGADDVMLFLRDLEGGA